MDSPPPRLARKLVRFLRTVTDRLEESTQPTHPASEPPPANGLRNRAAYEVAQRIGADWKESPYYDEAERFMDFCWSEIVWPMIFDCDFSVVVDLAAGHGRNSEKLRRLAGRIHVVDIVAENVEFCRRRFAGDSRFEFHVCDGMTFPHVPDGAASLVYCFDAMVHFDSDTVRSYLREMRRVVPPPRHRRQALPAPRAPPRRRRRRPLRSFPSVALLRSRPVPLDGCRVWR